MSGEPIVTICGNVAGEPDLRYSPGGVAVLGFTVAQTPRSKNKDTGNYEDGTTMWVRVTAFNKDAENTAESLSKGDRVLVTGRLTQEDWEDKTGAKRQSLKLLADEIGVSTKFATVKATKATRATGTSASRPPAPADDPWAVSEDSDVPF